MKTRSYPKRSSANMKGIGNGGARGSVGGAVARAGGIRKEGRTAGGVSTQKKNAENPYRAQKKNTMSASSITASKQVGSVGRRRQLVHSNASDGDARVRKAVVVERNETDSAPVSVKARAPSS